MLSTLRFPRAIKYRSVWHVAVMCRLGAESTSRSLQHGLFSAGEKLAWPSQRTSQRDRLTPRRSNKNGGLFDSNVVFFRSPLLRKVQT